MKYFFIAYAIIAALFIGLMPSRGGKFSEPPIRLFPDMDEQDKLKAQKPDRFFADGVGSRHPVAGTFPIGFQADGETEVGGIPEYEFGGAMGYYDTGVMGDYYGTGMPTEVALSPENADGFLRRGEELYNVHCMPCHGLSGDGQGIASQYGVPGVANLMLENYGSENYPDGRMYHVITNGQGNMGAYKHNIALRDRWAIVAYVRAMQLARAASLSDPDVQAVYQAAIARNEIELPTAEPEPEIIDAGQAPGAGNIKPALGQPQSRSSEVEANPPAPRPVDDTTTTPSE